MCAALLGLMLVCSTMILPAVAAAGVRRAGQQRRAVDAAIEADVDVAVAGDLERRDTGDRPDIGNQLGGDFLRRLLERFRQLKCDRQRQFAEGCLLRLFEYNLGIDAELRTHALAHDGLDLFL